MTLDDLKAQEARLAAQEHPWGFTFVSPGPHGLPIRPELLSENANGERVYRMSLKQLRKLIALAEATQ